MEKIFEILLSVTLSVLIVVHGETLEPTSMVPSTEAVPVEDISTVAPTTMAPTTMAPTTMAPTTMAPTTMAPTTMAPTTMAPTTVTPTPTPTPAPSNLTIWTVINSEGKACVLMTANITLNITYATTEKKNASKLFLVPQSANASGNCGNESQTLILTFDDDWMLTYIFKKIDKDQFGLDKTTLVFKSDSTLFPGITPEAGNKTVTSDINIPKVKAVNAYKCNAEQTVFFNTSVTPITGDLELQQFQVAAYKSEKIPPSHKVFGDAQQCPADSETSNIVPIVVGAALAALVVIVLIAYLVSRNRAQGGYESV